MNRLLSAAVLLALIPLSAFGAATITIVNVDGAGEGFNDPTPVAPIGGNTGTTLGQQRLNVFQAAANVWGATLTSSITIIVNAQFDPQTCTATGAVLGAAGPASVTANFVNAPVLNTWFHRALADKFRGFDGNPGQPDIIATFNSSLGSSGGVGPAAGCGFTFYLGLDNNHGPQTDLFAVVLHELGHGLGFSTATSSSTGAQASGLPHIYDTFLFDRTLNAAWPSMTDAQRAASAINNGNLVWTGANVNSGGLSILASGTPEMAVTAPSNIAGTYIATTPASGGGMVSFPGLTGELMPAIDGAGVSVTDACEAITGANAATIAGKVALVDRGNCTFLVKATNIQAAGAVGIIIVDNAAGSPPITPGGITAAITIPIVAVTQATGTTLKNQLAFRSRRGSGIFTTLRNNTAVRTGMDAQNRLRMYAPNPVQPGSSVSHFDLIAFPNLLMEPAINPDLTHSVVVPQDLTFQLLRDTGW